MKKITICNNTKKINVYYRTFQNNWGTNWKACENKKTIKTGNTFDEMVVYVREKENERYQVNVKFIV